MTVKAEKGVPLPADIGRTFGGPKYPWATMDVGESFPCDQVKRESAASQARRMGKQLGRTFVVRVNPATGEVRCWRTA